jgi:hypothetical protein
MANDRFPSFVDGMPLTRAALRFAADRHRGQQRDADHAAFILLASVRTIPVNVAARAWLSTSPSHASAVPLVQ